MKLKKPPPRSSAPGILAVSPVPPQKPLPLPLPPKQLKSWVDVKPWVVQSVQWTLAKSVQSATHSAVLPTMSKTPQLDLQFDRDPVFTRSPAALMLQSVLPLSVPGSGVPAAASCHSWLVSSRLPDSAHACAAWNQVTHTVGCTPATDTA